MGYFTDFMILGTYMNTGDAADSAAEAANNTYKMLKLQEKQIQNQEMQNELKQLIFSINKKFQKLEKSDNDDEYKYIELFFIMKELNDCEVTEEDFNELQDKQYFLDMTLSMEDCAKNLVKKLGQEKLTQANQYINAIFEEDYLNHGIEIETAKTELDKIEKEEKIKYETEDKKNKKKSIVIGLIGLIPIMFAILLLILSSLDPSPISNLVESTEHFETIIICSGLFGAVIILLIPIFCTTEHDREYIQKKKELTKIQLNYPDYTETSPVNLSDLSARRKEVVKILSTYGEDFKSYLKKNYQF